LGISSVEKLEPDLFSHTIGSYLTRKLRPHGIFCEAHVYPQLSGDTRVDLVFWRDFKVGRRKLHSSTYITEIDLFTSNCGLVLRLDVIAEQVKERLGIKEDALWAIDI